ncbi:flagella basal body rod protein [Ditylenchus destructor]|nr:flagella basal body rod protein [Ditylenchus destructor]
MRTGVSGMNAQANKLGTVGDNIANASTTGYKRASTSFSSLVLPSSSGSYASGGVQSNVRYSISEQGNLSYTTSSTDLAIQGNGFFVVQDGSGTPYLTRAATAPATLVQEKVELTFDPATNKLTTASPKSITINDANSGVAQAIDIDLSQMTQFSSKFTPGTAVLNGNGPSQIKDVEIGKDGLVTAVYQDGGRRNIYQLALATVPSVDNLSPQNGNVYLPSNESGVVTIGFAQTGSFGYIQKGALEGSNVDIASELTDMIESQRIYTANSKVFQTGSDLMDVLINLKR